MYFIDLSTAFVLSCSSTFAVKCCGIRHSASLRLGVCILNVSIAYKTALYYLVFIRVIAKCISQELLNDYSIKKITFFFFFYLFLVEPAF